MSSASGAKPGCKPFQKKKSSAALHAKLTEKYHEDPDAEHFVDIVDEPRFIAIVGSITVLNVIALGLESDFGCWKGWWGATCEDEGIFNFIAFDQLFTLAFVVDMGIRFYAYGGLQYIRGTSADGCHLLHLFDLMLVLLRVADVWVLSPMGIVTGLKVFSAFRIYHVLDWVRRIRMVAAYRELWLIHQSMEKCCLTIFWIAVLLTLFGWIFGTLLTVIVSDANPQRVRFDFTRSAWTIEDYWGTVPKSMYSLFQLVARDKWSSSLMRPLVFGGRAWIILPIVAFACITALGLVNTIVGAIVDRCLKEANENAERLDRDKTKMHLTVLDSLQSILEEADEDKSGDLDLDELQKALHTKRFQDRLQVLQIPHTDLELLFQLLDAEDEKVVNTKAFFRGCSRLIGPARAIDLHQMSVDLTRNITWAKTYLEKTAKTNAQLEGLLDLVEKVDIDIVQGDHDQLDPVLTARRGRQRENRAATLHHDEDASKDGSRRPSKRHDSKGHHSMLHHALAAGAFAWHDDKDQHNTRKSHEPPVPPHLRHKRGSVSSGHGPGESTMPRRSSSKNSVQSSRSSQRNIPKFSAD